MPAHLAPLVVVIFSLCCSACRTMSSATRVKVIGGTAMTAASPGALSTVKVLFGATPTQVDQQGVTASTPGCTGVLIRKNVVLTAGHCAVLADGSAPKTIFFEHSAIDAKLVGISNSIQHPDFDPVGNILFDDNHRFVSVSLKNDVSLLFLATDAPEPFQPIAEIADDAKLTSGTDLLIEGYGQTVATAGANTVLVLQAIDGKVLT